jgi:hypothetical protein
VTVATIGDPFLSVVVAESWSVPGSATEVDGALMVVEVNTGTTTVMRTVFVAVESPAVAVAVIVAGAPVATPVTRPLPLTLAVPDADELHATLAAIAVPNWSFAVAVSCTATPVEIVVLGAAIVTEASTRVTGEVLSPPPEQAAKVSATARNVTIERGEMVDS